MNKIKFEAYLREKLVVLKQSEIDEIINEYLQHIDMRRAEGVSEEQAILDFGDLNVLVSEILDAYKIDTNRNQFDDFSITVKRWLHVGLDYINKIANSLMNRQGSEIVALIVEFIIVIILLVAIGSTIDIVATLIVRTTYYGPYAITRIISFVVRILSSLLNLMISLSVLYWFANERIIKFKSKDLKSSNQDILKTKLNLSSQDDGNNSKKDVQHDQSDFVQDNIDADEINNIEKDKAILQAQINDRTFGQMLFDGNMKILRVIMLVILIPMIVTGVFLAIAFIVIVYNTILGYGSIGISLILSGILLIFFYILINLIKFVSGGK